MTDCAVHSFYEQQLSSISFVYFQNENDLSSESMFCQIPFSTAKLQNSLMAS